MTVTKANRAPLWGVGNVVYTVTTFKDDSPIIKDWQVCGVRAARITTCRHPSFRYRCARRGEESLFLEHELFSEEGAKREWEKKIKELIELHKSEELHLRQLLSKGPKLRE